jgi:hypothetical protein
MVDSLWVSERFLHAWVSILQTVEEEKLHLFIDQADFSYEAWFMPWAGRRPPLDGDVLEAEILL